MKHTFLKSQAEKMVCYRFPATRRSMFEEDGVKMKLNETREGKGEKGNQTCRTAGSGPSTEDYILTYVRLIREKL